MNTPTDSYTGENEHTAVSEENRQKLNRLTFSVPSARVQKQPSESKKYSFNLADFNARSSSGYLKVKAKLHQRLLNTLEQKKILDSSEEKIREEIIHFTKQVLDNEDLALNNHERRILSDDLIQETLGVGPLAPLMNDPAISDILVNSSSCVYVERFGRLEKTNITFRDEEHLMRIIQRIVARVGRRIDESSPMVDARLPDGSRVNATFPPVSLDGPTLSIRRFGNVRYEFDDLRRLSMFSDEMSDFLAACVKARKNILISGGGGVGKSTFLSALSQYVPQNDRMITIEDAVELRLEKENLVRFETRSANAEGVGNISTRDLVVNALRMRPDRIIVGEVRGSEALDMLQAMNTGHEGSMTTIHANSSKDALSRIETMVLLAGTDLPSRAIREQIASAIHVIIHIRRFEDGIRRIDNISEVERLDDTQLIVKDLYKFIHRGFEDGRVLGHFSGCDAVPAFWDELKLYDTQLDEAMFKKEEET